MKNVKAIVLAASLLLGTNCTIAQEHGGLVKHLDIGVTAGSPGFGIDVAVPVVKDVQLRVGGAWTPHVQIKSKYRVEVGDEGGTDQEKDERFEKLSTLLESFTGQHVTNRVGMLREPTMNNVKMLVDVFPFRNKKWHVTGGFYWGGKQIGRTYNNTQAMTCLLAVKMYNNMYEKALADEPLFEYNGMQADLPPTFKDKLINYGDMAIHIGDFKHDIIAQEDVLYKYSCAEYDEVAGVFIEHEAGDVRVAKGEVLYHKGEQYRMKPSDYDNMVRATAIVNAFKPYVGFGYGGPISKKSDRINFTFDCGVLFWGSEPKLKAHDGIDISHDLTNLHKSIRSDVKAMNALKVYPVLDLRLSYRLF